MAETTKEKVVPHPPHMRRDRGLALQATLEIEPADKRQPLVFRSDLVIGPSLIERFDAFEAGDLLARKTHLLELSIPCLPGRVLRHGRELLSEFHNHSPSVTGAPWIRAVPYPALAMWAIHFLMKRV